MHPPPRLALGDVLAKPGDDGLEEGGGQDQQSSLEPVGDQLRCEVHAVFTLTAGT